jgi:ribosomal protein S18 acetylase RimI-like enzyme
MHRPVDPEREQEQTADVTRRATERPRSGAPVSNRRRASRIAAMVATPFGRVARLRQGWARVAITRERPASCEYRSRVNSPNQAVGASDETQVREAVPADAGAVAAIGQVAFPALHRGVLEPAMIDLIVTETYSIASVRDCIETCARSDRAHFLVAERRGTVVGYLHYDSSGAEPELHRIYVDPAQKRAGIGSALMREHHARLRPGDSYILMVFAANDEAISFYRKHDLTEEARVDAFEFYREHMGVGFPPHTPPLPAVIFRFTRSKPEATAAP